MKNRFRVVSLLLCLLLCLSVVSLTGCKSKKQKTSSYEITATLSDNTLTGKQKVTFYNNSDNAFSQLKFNLYPNAYRENAKYSPVSLQYQTRAYYAGKDYGYITINGVWSEDGKALDYSIDGEDQNILCVTLLDSVFPEESVSITIDFTTVIAKVVSRLGINKKTINLANFYPILCAISNDSFYECVYYSIGDPFFSDCSDYKVSITVDEEFIIASSGSLTGSTNKDGKTTYNYQANSLRSFAVVLCKDFEMISAKCGEVTVNYYYYNDENAQKSLQTAVESVEYFSKTFGDYVYNNYSVVQTCFLQGGMEFSGLVMISDNLENNAYKEVIIHETAHQWWQVAVGNNEIEHAFLDEGLTEYSVVLFYENHSEYGFTRSQLIKSSEQTYKAYCSVYEKLFNQVNTTMLRPLSDFNGEYEYVNLSYVKPCIMFDYLRTTVGDGKFFKAIKNYYQENKLKIVTPEHLVGAFERCGTDTNGFFDGFFYGKVII